MQPIRIGIVGIGKIARDQHIPSLAANAAFAFCATASRHSEIAGIPNFATLKAMLQGMPDLEAVSICTPPQTHYADAKLALEQGKHVLLEKPPCTSIMQLESLVRLANTVGRTLYQSWHSQHARGVAAAARLLKEPRLRRVRVSWKEDVRRWHPGQTWIWRAGGFGVFDPGINALSILAKILPEPLFAKSARLLVPSNCDAPIAAQVELLCDSGSEISMTLDFLHTGTQIWDIEIESDAETIRLSAGGSTLTIGNEPAPPERGALESEYQAIYRRFAQLIAAGQSDVDARPLSIVADIFLVAQQVPAEPFTY